MMTDYARARLVAIAVAAPLVCALLVSSAYAAKMRGNFEQRFELSHVAAVLHSDDIVIRPTRSDEFIYLGPFQLSQHTGQGPNVWYVGHLHFAIRVKKLEGAGRIYVSADTDNRTFAQVEFERVQTRQGKAIRWSTYDLFGGDTIRTVRRRTINISFFNYLQNRGVRPGGNGVRLHIEQYGKAEVASVVVHRDTSIERTHRPPTPLALTLRPLDPQPAVGKTFRIQVSVATKTRGDVLRRVSVTPTYDAADFRLVKREGPARLAVLRGAATVTYTFRPRRAGKLELGFVAESNINTPRTAVLVDVAPATESWLLQRGHWLGLLLLATGSVIVVALRVRRPSLAVREYQQRGETVT